MSEDFKSYAELHAERAELLELIAQARDLIGHIGWTSAERTDVIRRAATWLAANRESGDRLNSDGGAAQIGKWIAASTYRTVIHRHNGIFIALDEAQGRMASASTLQQLADALLGWPEGTKPLPPQTYVRVEL